MIDSKPCNECGKVLALDAFHVNVHGKLGRQAKCKTCIRALYYEPRKVVIFERGRQRRTSEDVRARERAWQSNNRRSNPIPRILQEAKSRARKKGIEFSITSDDVTVPAVCPVLNIPIGMSFGARSDNSLSIDRIDGSKGYIPGNVRIISWRANRLKNDGTLEELRAIVSYIESALAVAVTTSFQLEQREAA